MGKPPTFKVSNGSYTISPGPGKYNMRKSFENLELSSTKGKFAKLGLRSIDEF